jgi:CheY-like chemotaxis protein
MAERVLSRAGYTVIAAEDGAEALEKFKENPDVVRLLVLDAVMPGVGELEVCEKIRAIKPEIPTLFCSGYSEDFATGGAGLPKNSVLLQKPYSLDELLASIRQILDQ